MGCGVYLVHLPRNLSLNKANCRGPLLAFRSDVKKLLQEYQTWVVFGTNQQEAAVTDQLLDAVCYGKQLLPSVVLAAPLTRLPSGTHAAALTCPPAAHRPRPLLPANP